MTKLPVFASFSPVTYGSYLPIPYLSPSYLPFSRQLSSYLPVSHLVPTGTFESWSLFSTTDKKILICGDWNGRVVTIATGSYLPIPYLLPSYLPVSHQLYPVISRFLNCNPVIWQFPTGSITQLFASCFFVTQLFASFFFVTQLFASFSFVTLLFACSYVLDTYIMVNVPIYDTLSAVKKLVHLEVGQCILLF